MSASSWRINWPAWRQYLPKAAKEEIARIVLEVKFGGVNPKEVTA